MNDTPRLTWMVRGAVKLVGRTAVFFLTAASPMTAVQQSPTLGASLVFDGVTVVDVDQGKLVPSQRVVIVGNRIQAVGAASAVKMPTGAQVVDATGKYLIPGLWDLHVHTNSDFTYAYAFVLALGVTGIRDAGSFVPLDTLMQAQRAILAGTQVGPPRQLRTGGVFGLTLAMRGEAKDSAKVAHLIDSLKAQGANFLKVRPFSQYLIVAAAARRAGLPFGGHVGQPGDTAVPSAIAASDSGMRIIDHTASFDMPGGLDTLCYGPQASVARCQPVAERFRRNNTWSVPTLTVYRDPQQRGRVTDDSVPPVFDAAVFLRLQERSVFTPASEPIYRRLQDVSSHFWSESAAPGSWLHDVPSAPVADSVRFLRVAQRVGLPILAGTDAALGGETAAAMVNRATGFALHAELAMYVAEGMTPLAALQSATLNPAKMLGATDSLGTVAAGKLADLVLLDANPLEDITNTTTVRAVVANGRYFDRAALDGLLAQAQAH